MTRRMRLASVALLCLPTLAWAEPIGFVGSFDQLFRVDYGTNQSTLVGSSIEFADVEGLAFTTVKGPAGKSKTPECGGFVFEQPGARAGLRLFTRQEPITISTLVSAEKLDGAIAFGLGAAGGVPQKTWPVTLGQPLANGLWRVALSLKAPRPGGNLEIRVMKDELLLDDSCITQFIAR